MNYYKQIKIKILDNEAYEKIKDYSKERHKVLTYFEIGRLLKFLDIKYKWLFLSFYFAQNCQKTAIINFMNHYTIIN